MKKITLASQISGEGLYFLKIMKIKSLPITLIYIYLYLFKRQVYKHKDFFNVTFIQDVEDYDSL